MKKLLLLLSGSFQGRLLLYVLLVGAIPLGCALLVFYRQSSVYADKELGAYVRQTHDQLLLGIRQAFAEIDHMSKNLANDYAVQKYLEPAALREAEERSIKDYIDYSLKQRMNQLKYVTDICLTVDETGFTMCTQDNMLSTLPAPGPLQRNERLIEAIDRESGDADGYQIRYVVPLYDVKSNVVRGSISMLVRLNVLLAEQQNRQPLRNHIIYDAKGTVVYQLRQTTGEIAPFGGDPADNVLTVRGDTFISQRNVGLAGTDWVSRITVQNQLPYSSYQSLRTTFIVFFILLVLLSGVSSILFSRFVTKPLRELRGLMKRAELGDLKAYWIAKGSQEMNDLGISYNQMLNRLEDLIKQVKREEALKKEAEIEALQYQLNPHFLYNTLSTIKWVAKLHKTPQISEVVSALVRLLQASLGKKGDFLTIREEIGLIQDYMEIQRFRYGDKMKLETDIDPIAESCLVPRMILQPLVENAIIHGIEPSGREGRIRIKAWTERDILFCQVEDNGIGLEQREAMQQAPRGSLKERMSGIGLTHIRQKIKLYYGDDSKMYLISKEREGTTVRLSLPIHQSEGTL